MSQGMWQGEPVFPQSSDEDKKFLSSDNTEEAKKVNVYNGKRPDEWTARQKAAVSAAAFEIKKLSKGEKE